MRRSGQLQTAALTLVALLAFAANSLLCRMALGQAAIDPLSFTSVRLLSGVLALVPLAKLSAPEVAVTRAGAWRSGLALFTYAIAFSWAYVSLSTATGALILFGSVQLTMITAGMIAGERLGPGQALGIAIAAAGLAYLLLPGATSPSLHGALSMMVAGMAWGFYSLWGRGVALPLVLTAGNFLRAASFAIAVSACALGAARVSPRGLLLAAISGALTSGLGYAVWYRALRQHTAASAAVVQIAVPLIAAAFGVILLGEHFSVRLAIASAVTLSGICVSLLSRRL